ncbi:MAG: LysR family transcriptional regulator [Lachnospiraceae bacterium]|nr:LysR family transcriptional regulator [Lachnospiraceae bacterium]
MDTKHLTTFLTFSEEKTYLRTSLKLNYAPSTLAEHIGALEQELGVKLVESRGKRTILTKGGEAFLPYARKIMGEYKVTCQAMASYNRIQGDLRVRAVESLALYSLSSVFARFASKYPQVHLSVGIGNCDSMAQLLKSDAADVAFIYDMEPIHSQDMSTVVLFKEDLLFVVSPKHRLAKKAEVVPTDFKHETFILAQKDCYYSSAFNTMLKNSHVDIDQKLEFDSGNLIKEYIKLGKGISLLPVSVVRREIEAGELVSLDWKGPKWEVYAQSVALNLEWPLPSVSKLVELAQEETGSLR